VEAADLAGLVVVEVLEAFAHLLVVLLAEVLQQNLNYS
tara:strand:+ start:148 stop:261 length:114 start_codon:yes stop_codon:yes gene_type:complete